MCLDDPDEIIAELHRLRDARAEREKWPPPFGPNGGEMHIMEVTTTEGMRLLDQRIADAEASIKQLGFTGKVVRVDSGEGQLVIHSR